MRTITFRLLPALSLALILTLLHLGLWMNSSRANNCDNLYIQQCSCPNAQYPVCGTCANQADCQFGGTCHGGIVQNGPFCLAGPGLYNCPWSTTLQPLCVKLYYCQFVRGQGCLINTMAPFQDTYNNGGYVENSCS